LIASTILQTATAETAPFRVRRQRRRAMIAGSDGAPLTRRAPVVELVGTAHSPEGLAGEDELTWFSNRQGCLGRGSYLTADNLLPGEHAITLVAADGLGGETRARTVVRISGENET
jgi:hypothetical protein